MLKEHAGNQFNLKRLALLDQREEELGEEFFSLSRVTPDCQNPFLLFPRSQHEGGCGEVLKILRSWRFSSALRGKGRRGREGR
jgi:hypothetical protein